MKKIFFLIMLFCAFFSTSSAEDIPPKFDSVMNVWNASSAEELRVNICEYWMTKYKPAKAYEPRLFPVKIRIGGTTQELISDKKNWDMAIVSSKDVDLSQLVEGKLISGNPFDPSLVCALHEWLLEPQLRQLLPYHSTFLYNVFLYDYLPESDEAILLIEQNWKWRKKSNYINFGAEFIETMMHNRPAEQVRRLERINCVWDWTAEQLLNNSSDWDVALLENFPLEDIEMLDQAGILRHFDDVDYFMQRPAVIQIPRRSDCFMSFIKNSKGSMVAVPYDTNGGNDYIMLVNTQGCNIPLSLDFAVHLAKSYEWFFQTPWDKLYKAPNGQGFANTIHISREDMDW